LQVSDGPLTQVTFVTQTYTSIQWSSGSMQDNEGMYEGRVTAGRAAHPTTGLSVDNASCNNIQSSR